MTCACFPLRMGGFLGMTRVNEWNSCRVVDGRWLVYRDLVGDSERSTHPNRCSLCNGNTTGSMKLTLTSYGYWDCLRSLGPL
jgi:hypothetical protein